MTRHETHTQGRHGLYKRLNTREDTFFSDYSDKCIVCDCPLCICAPVVRQSIGRSGAQIPESVAGVFGPVPMIARPLKATRRRARRHRFPYNALKRSREKVGEAL
jgi:hypothetical protein